MGLDWHSHLTVVVGYSTEMEVVFAEKLLNAQRFLGNSGSSEDIGLPVCRELLFLNGNDLVEADLFPCELLLIDLLVFGHRSKLLDLAEG